MRCPLLLATRRRSLQTFFLLATWPILFVLCRHSWWVYELTTPLARSASVGLRMGWRSTSPLASSDRCVVTHHPYHTRRRRPTKATHSSSSSITTKSRSGGPPVLVLMWCCWWWWWLVGRRWCTVVGGGGEELVLGVHCSARLEEVQGEHVHHQRRHGLPKRERERERGEITRTR